LVSISIQVYGDGIDAIALACRLRAIVKDMTQVGITPGTSDFDSAHTKAHVFDLVDAFGIDGVKEAGPTTAGVEFLIGAKEFGIATGAAIDTFVVAVPIHAGEGAFGSFLAGDVILFGGELLAPFFVCFGNFFVGHMRSP
jgi:hypothetical protein